MGELLIALSIPGAGVLVVIGLGIYTAMRIYRHITRSRP